MKKRIALSVPTLRRTLAMALVADKVFFKNGEYETLVKVFFEEEAKEEGWDCESLTELYDGVADRATEFIKKYKQPKEVTKYDHPQRYTGEDGKDLIDRMEEGLINEEQTRGFLKGNALKYLVRYEDKGGMDDLIKANEYLRRLIAFEDGGDSDD